ncbi:hypothetical protein Tco_0086692 [Tanacetum coccineum]
MVNDRIVVNLDETGQPVGDEGNEFTNFLGTLVKMPQHVSLKCRDWRKLSEDKKADLWNIVKEKFSFEPAETKQIREWALSDMGNKLKSWRYELKKKYYDPSLTIEEILAAQNDERVDKEEFRDLVTRWFDKKTQVESETKKLICSKSNEPHVTGTKSFARITHEETQKNGFAPSRGGLYILTRTYKDGSTASAEAADVIKNDDLAKVKGPEKRGHIRCRGKIVKAIRNGYHASEDPQVPQLKARINELENEIKGMKETQMEMVRFMASFKAANGCPRGISTTSRASAYNHCPCESSYNDAPRGHPTSSRESSYNSDFILDPFTIVSNFMAAASDTSLFWVGNETCEVAQDGKHILLVIVFVVCALRCAAV